jgi:S1-C subfamily serine protease
MVPPKKVIVGDALPGIAMAEDLSVADRGRVVGENIVGTAFTVDVRGYFLTAKHVMQGLQANHLELRTTYRAKPSEGYAVAKFPVQAIYPHPVLDVAILAVVLNSH